MGQYPQVLLLHWPKRSGLKIGPESVDVYILYFINYSLLLVYKTITVLYLRLTPSTARDLSQGAVLEVMKTSGTACRAVLEHLLASRS